MKAARFDYCRPVSAAEALARLAPESSEPLAPPVPSSPAIAKPMSGGQSLGPMLNLRLSRPDRIVDLSAIPAMKIVRVTEAGIEIGAGVTHAEIEDGRHDPLRGHPLQEVAAGIAYRAIRNRGTVGGSLAHADPAADWIVVMTAFAATLTLESARGRRQVAMKDFMQGAYTTAIREDEILLSLTLPLLAADTHWGYHKICRKPGEFAQASAAVLFSRSQRVARIVLGAAEGPPRELTVLAAAVAREGAAAAQRPAVVAAVRAALPDRDAIDCGLHAVSVERALERAGMPTVRAVPVSSDDPRTGGAA